MIMQPEYKTFNEIIAFKLFRIPEYQRHYSWQEKHRRDLFDDIVKLRDIREKDPTRTHFMATFVCLNTQYRKTSGTDDFLIYDVIDGQQRLTTMVILLKAISKALYELPSLVDEAKMLDVLLVKRNRLLIILQNNHDYPGILRAYLENGHKPDKDKIKTEADSNLNQAIIECEAFVASFSDVSKLLQLIKNHIKCIFLELDDEGSAYTIFEVLNSRGLEVDCLDKCKSLLMGLLYEYAGGKDNDTFKELQHELRRSWSEIYDYIGLRYIPGQEIVRFAATLRTTKEKGKPLSEEEALNFFKEDCTKDSDNELKIKQIIDNTLWLAKIACRLKELYSSPRQKAVTSVTQARLLAVSIKLTERLSEEEKKKLLDQWERTTFKIYGLSGKDSRSNVGDYIRLAKKIQREPSLTYIDLLHEIAKIGKDTRIEDAVSQLLGRKNGYDGEQNELRYFFYRYEEYLAEKKDPYYKPNQVAWDEIWKSDLNKSIEHILPQTLPPEPLPPDKMQDTDWRSCFTDSEHEDWKHSIGNLCLVPPHLQGTLSNNPFAIKLPIYKKINLLLLDEIVTDNNGRTRSKWDKVAIEHRRDKLIEFAIDHWKDLES